MNFLEKYNNGQTLLVDKDLDWTSFDVVKKIKNVQENHFIEIIN